MSDVTTNVVNETKTPKTPKAAESKITKISLDNSVESVIELDSQGMKLFFESDPGKFLALPEDTVRKLSATNRDSYLFALLARQREQKAKPSEGLQIQPEMAMASDRLDFEYSAAFLAKYHPCLKRPDELRRAYREGYTHVTASDGVSGFGVSESTGNIFVGTVGRVEQYLLKIPKEVADKRLKESEERSKSFVSSIDHQTSEKLEKLGGKPFTPKERDDKSWKTLE